MREIIGKWEFKNNKVFADTNCEIIEYMIQNELSKIESSDDGWTIKYKDNNGGVWKLTYPESHLQGGGPPKLQQIQ